MITIEAKRLSGVDRGKTIRLYEDNPNRRHEGELMETNHTIGGDVKLVYRDQQKRLIRVTIKPDHHVTIEGAKS